MVGFIFIGIIFKCCLMVWVFVSGGYDILNWLMLMDVYEKWYVKFDVGKFLIFFVDEDFQMLYDVWVDDMVLVEGIVCYQLFVIEEVMWVEYIWVGL